MGNATIADIPGTGMGTTSGIENAKSETPKEDVPNPAQICSTVNHSSELFSSSAFNTAEVLCASDFAVPASSCGASSGADRFTLETLFLAGTFLSGDFSGKADSCQSFSVDLAFLVLALRLFGASFDEPVLALLEAVFNGVFLGFSVVIHLNKAISAIKVNFKLYGE